MASRSVFKRPSGLRRQRRAACSLIVRANRCASRGRAAEAAEAPEADPTLGTSWLVATGVLKRGVARLEQSAVGRGVVGAGTYAPELGVTRTASDEPTSSVHGVSEHSVPPAKHELPAMDGTVGAMASA